MSTCYHPGCENPRAGECGFCEAHKQAMKTPAVRQERTAPAAYDECVCGAPAHRDYLCAMCYTHERPRLFKS